MQFSVVPRLAIFVYECVSFLWNMSSCWLLLVFDILLVVVVSILSLCRCVQCIFRLLVDFY